MKQIKIVLLFLIVIAAQTVNAQENYTLYDAIETAKRNNIKLREQQLDVQIAENAIDQAKAQGLPQLNTGFNYQRTLLNAFAQRTSGNEDSTLPPIDPQLFPMFNEAQIAGIQGISAQTTGGFFSGLGDAFAAKHQGTFTGNLNQQLFDGVYLIGLKAAEVYVDISKMQSAPNKRDIAKDVEKAYYGALITKENIDILDKNISNLEQLLFETKEIYKAGFAEQLDIDRLELSVNTLKTQRTTLEKIHDLNYNVLKNTMSLPLNTNIELAEDIETFEKIARDDKILAEVQNPERWPEFQLLDMQERIQKLDIQRYEYGKYPKVNAFANGSIGYQGNEFIFNEGWYPNLVVGLNVSLNILDGGLRKNRIYQKKLEMEKIQVQKQNLQQNVDIAIDSSLTTYLNAKTNIETQEKNIALAEKIYNTTKIKYKAGVGSSIEMNQAEQSLYQAQQNYISALYELLIAKVDLEKALGK